MPIERWTTAQVLALAPDASSAKGAQSVSAARKWQSVGLDDDLLWGLCQGSGSKPYQACVDLTEPAYRCSCPSRKFPCKHALGLLLLWSAGEVGEAAAQDWAAEWREKRAGRAEKATTRRTESGPADPDAARRRAEQRADRIAAGLAELDRWLLDQVAQGLAAAERDGSRPYETMAARLVDAQAPGVAAAVRRLGGLVGVGPVWADRLLGELAMLRLLVAGHSRLAELPAPLAATVRSRVGVPVATDDVLATPPVRDQWQVLGQVEVVDEKLTTRRTWLHGAGTGRFALLLAFAAPGQAFPADVVPGTTIDADLCFYPAANPLRALIAHRHDAVRGTGAPTGAVRIARALADWSAALAAEPWCERVPVLLDRVVPSADGHLVDADGDALPLHPGFDEPWWLMAAAGGRPVTVAGEYGPSGLRPIAAWPDDVRVPAEPGPDRAGRRPQLPPELLSAALVGTDRRPWAGETVRVDDRALTGAGDDAAGGLLEATAVALAYRRAGVTPVTGRTPVSPAPDETLPTVPPAAARRLALLLSGAGVPGGGETAQHLLAEWLRYAAEGGWRVPAEALPALLEAGRRRTAVRPALARVAGQRGGWLAALRADWRYLLIEAAVDPDPAQWHTGTPGQRLAHLVALRRTDPGAAVDLLAATFDDETPEDRARLLGTLDTGLSDRDEPLLDRALRDRRKEVRDVAADLLSRLPRSAYGQRMAARLLDCLHLGLDDGGREALLVTPTKESDADLRRDGVNPKPPRGMGRQAWLLEEILARTPLETLPGTWGRAPAELLALPVVDNWEMTLHRGLARAVVTQGHQGWAEALADRLAAHEHDESFRAKLSTLFEALPPDALARQAARALRHDPARAYWMVDLHPGPWPDDLSSAVLEAVRTMATTDRYAWHSAEFCRAAAIAMPVDRVEDVTALADSLDTSQSGGSRAVAALRQLAAALTFRHEMHEELR